MKHAHHIEHLLAHHDIRPTTNRMLVADALMSASRPMSIREIETVLDTVDTSSIFRVLKLFAEKDVIHEIDDGSGSLRYELCKAHGQHSISDMHMHFFCERCRKTFCLDTVPMPRLDLPDGFSANAINFVIKGICRACAR